MEPRLFLILGLVLLEERLEFRIVEGDVVGEVGAVRGGAGDFVHGFIPGVVAEESGLHAEFAGLLDRVGVLGHVARNEEARPEPARGSS